MIRCENATPSSLPEFGEMTVRTASNSPKAPGTADNKRARETVEDGSVRVCESQSMSRTGRFYSTLQ